LSDGGVSSGKTPKKDPAKKRNFKVPRIDAVIEYPPWPNVAAKCRKIKEAHAEQCAATETSCHFRSRARPSRHGTELDSAEVEWIWMHRPEAREREQGERLTATRIGEAVGVNQSAISNIWAGLSHTNVTNRIGS